eukprot:3422264-Pyramimonas_sp.AAC.1
MYAAYVGSAGLGTSLGMRLCHLLHSLASSTQELGDLMFYNQEHNIVHSNDRCIRAMLLVWRYQTRR